MKNIELIEAKKYFLAIADTTKDMIHLNDSEGRIIYANQATELLLGYPLNEIRDTFAFEIIHPDDREVVQNDMRSILPGENHLPARDIRLLKKDGSYLDVEVRGFVVDFDEDKYLGAVIRDISRRKKAERELKAHQENLEKLVEERTQKLTKALEEVKILKGTFPICSFCKKIRDDKGYWNQVEEYIRQHSEAEFSHSFCPECAKEHYPWFKYPKE